jgi:RsiW-degrading membrane proteinase PrsW (M82 family)
MVEDAVIINAVLSLGLLAIILFLDRYERESIFALAKIFFLSILATSLFGFAKTVLVGGHEFTPFFESFVAAGFFEEALKFALLTFVVYRLKEFNESFDLIVYMGTIALGFEFFENVNYYLRITNPGAFWQALTSDASLYNKQLLLALAARLTPGHLLFDLSAVYVIGRAEKIRLARILEAFACAWILHGTWNMLAGSIWVIPYTFILTVLATASMVRLSLMSEFRKKRQECENLIGNNIYLLRNAGEFLDSNLKLRAVDSLKKIRSGLASLRYLRGVEQREFYNFFKTTFPSPVLRPRDKGLEDSLVGLKFLEERLAAYKDIKFDWSYYAGLLIALLFAAFLALSLGGLISLFLG